MKAKIAFVDLANFDPSPLAPCKVQAGVEV
jgi:hypothetical protein